MTDCERCTVSRPEPVPFLTHEKDMARMERVNFHQWIVILVLIVALVASNVGWVIYENQFEDVVTTVSQENESGYNNYIGNDGDIYNGEANDNSQEENP